MQKLLFRHSPRAMRFSLAGALALFLAACAGGAYLHVDDGTGEGARPGAGNEHFTTLHPSRFEIHGIDVSRWQGDIDWRALRASGVKFAFIKATEGGDHIDPKFRQNWDGAKAAGIPRGAYHFVWWCRPAHEQVRWFKRHIPRDPDSLPPVLDVEWQHGSQCNRKVSRTQVLEKMRIMLAALQEHTGKKPIIYTDINFHEDILEGEFNDYPYWLRSTAAPLKHRYKREKWEFWQFTTTGRVPGITGDVDRNAFFGSEREFAAWREGRFDIGTRRWRGGEPKVAGGKPPATAAGARTPQAAAGTPLRPPPARIPQHTASAD